MVVVVLEITPGGAGGKGGSLVLESAWGDTISSLVATVVGPLPVLSHR